MDGFQAPNLALFAGKNTNSALLSDVQFPCYASSNEESAMKQSVKGQFNSFGITIKIDNKYDNDEMTKSNI